MPGGAVWHLLQVSSQSEADFARALAQGLQVTAWEPVGSCRMPALEPAHSSLLHPFEPSLRSCRLSRMYGGGGSGLSLFVVPGSGVVRRLSSGTDPSLSTLVCTRPYFASVAEQWPGPVVYWPEHEVACSHQGTLRRLQRFEQTICSVAALVCPRSASAAQRLLHIAGCDPEKIRLIPEATRCENLLHLPPFEVPALPGSERNIPRPAVGVLCDPAHAFDWILLLEAVQATPWLSWVFVGATSERVADDFEERARQAVLAAPTTYFVGEVSEARLSEYTRAFDVAVIPQAAGRRDRVLPWVPDRGFFDQLAACRPVILAAYPASSLPAEWQVIEACGHEELTDALARLQRLSFDDGQTAARWKASRVETWQNRARAMEMERADRLRPFDMHSQIRSA